MPAVVRLAFSANAFKQSSLPDALDAIAAAGYGAAEVMADAPHLDPIGLTPGGRDAVREMLERRSLAASNVNAFTGFGCPLCRAGDDALGRPCGDTYHPTWIEDDPALVAWRVDHTIASIRLAAAIGSATVSVQPGGPLIGTRLTREQASDRFAAALGRVLSAAGDHGVTVAVEPEPGLLIESAAESIAFKTVYFDADDRVRMNCDVGHLFCVGDDPAGVIRDQQPRRWRTSTSRTSAATASTSTSRPAGARSTSRRSSRPWARSGTAGG